MPSVQVVVQLRTAQAIAAIQDAAWRAAKQTAVAIEQDIKGLGPHAQPALRSQGRFVPSEPGTPPRPRSGNLRRSYHVEFDEANHVARVGSDPAIAPYAIFLELGTSRMAARPALIPAAEFHAATLARLVAENITEALS